MFAMYSDDDINKAYDQVEAVQAESNLPDFEFARILLGVAENIVRKEAQKYVDAGMRLHEPDFVSTAEKIAGVVEHTSPTTQCR